MAFIVLILSVGLIAWRRFIEKPALYLVVTFITWCVVLWSYKYIQTYIRALSFLRPAGFIIYVLLISVTTVLLCRKFKNSTRAKTLISSIGMLLCPFLVAGWSIKHAVSTIKYFLGK